MKITKSNPFGIDKNGNSGPIEMPAAEFALLLKKTQLAKHRPVSSLTDNERQQAAHNFFRPDGGQAVVRPPEPAMPSLPVPIPEVKEEKPVMKKHLDTSMRPINIDNEE